MLPSVCWSSVESHSVECLHWTVDKINFLLQIICSKLSPEVVHLPAPCESQYGWLELLICIRWLTVKCTAIQVRLHLMWRWFGLWRFAKPYSAATQTCLADVNVEKSYSKRRPIVQQWPLAIVNLKYSGNITSNLVFFSSFKICDFGKFWNITKNS